MTLSNYEVVTQINRKLSLTTIAIATSPAEQHRALSQFALSVNNILAQRDENHHDARCPNCGHHLFQPDPEDQQR